MNAKNPQSKTETFETCIEAGGLSLIPWRRHPAVTLFQSAPVLRSIWRADLADIAAMHTRQWETDTDESGRIFIAWADGAMVGITGWYRMSASEAGLRWHGVVPCERNKGYSRQMLDLVCRDLPKKIRHLYEVTRNPQSRDAFCRCGFGVVTDPEVIRRTIEDAEYDIGADGWVLRKPLRDR